MVILLALDCLYFILVNVFISAQVTYKNNKYLDPAFGSYRCIENIATTAYTAEYTTTITKSVIISSYISIHTQSNATINVIDDVSNINSQEIAKNLLLLYILI